MRVCRALSPTKNTFLHLCCHSVHMCPNTPRGSAEQRRSGRAGGPTGGFKGLHTLPACLPVDRGGGVGEAETVRAATDVRINSRKINTLTGTGFVSSFCDKTVSIFLSFSKKTVECCAVLFDEY